MPTEINVSDYLSSFGDIDRESIDIANKTAHIAYGSMGIRTAMIAFDTKHTSEYKELNVVLGPCCFDGDISRFQEGDSNDNMRGLNTYMRQNFKIRIVNYNGLWVLRRLDHEEIDKLPRVEHRPKIEMEGASPLNLFLELKGINPYRLDELRLADYIDRYAILQDGCQSD